MAVLINSAEKTRAAVSARTAFVGGEFVRNFERQYADAYGVQHCVSCANGTDAIYIVLRMLGIGAGDEVVTTGSFLLKTETLKSSIGAGCCEGE